MTIDRNKGISVAYNYLNLPEHVTWDADGRKIEWLYSSNGAKLQNTIINENGQVDKTTNYINGLYWYKGVYPDMLFIEGARFGIYPASFSGNPQIGQRHTMDPADEYYSPYSYVGNNPVYFKDREGYNGIGFQVELDYGFVSISGIFALKLGTLDNPKFQIGFLSNRGDRAPNGDVVGAGLAVSGSIVLAIGSEKLNDWESINGIEYDLDAGALGGQISYDPDSKVFF